MFSTTFPLEEDLSCPICFEEYNLTETKRTAKLLLCLHTFCYNCLNNLLLAYGIIMCPICRRWQEVHGDPLEELLDNDAVVTHLRSKMKEKDGELALEIYSEEWFKKFMSDNPHRASEENVLRPLVKKSLKDCYRWAEDHRKDIQIENLCPEQRNRNVQEQEGQPPNLTPHQSLRGRKIFIRTEEYEDSISEDDIARFFMNKIGPIHCISLHRHRKDDGRYFAYAIIDFHNEIDFIHSNVYEIKGCVFETQFCSKNEGKVFLAHVRPDISLEQLSSYFSQFGRVKDMCRPHNYLRNVPASYCFLTFHEEESAHEVLKSPLHIIRDSRFVVKPYIPRCSFKIVRQYIL